MRLLNVQTLTLEEFNAHQLPSYAILSHTWGREEVLLNDVVTARAGSLGGYAKLQGCCEQARHDGFDYVWVDTCCIDKTSSSELTEAINSMFTWYRRSVVCYAYLEDLEAAAVRDDPSLLCKSRWFTRGWTLQELIAPSVIVFYGAGWEEIGSRDDLLSEISAVTGIEPALFMHGKLSNYSVAQRMSWAARRQTTRVEDEAYCLLGIFGVNMPMLYGEGKMAFVRLQEEIMRRSDDQSIFAWAMTETSESGLLAPSASCFAEGGEIMAADESAHHEPFFLTNKGIQITLPVYRTSQDHIPPFEPISSGGRAPNIVVTPPDSMIAVLNCQTRSGKRVALALDRQDHDPRANTPYHRINADLGPMYLRAATREDSIRPTKVIVRAHERHDNLKLWDQLRPTFFGIRQHAESHPGFKLVYSINATAAEASGIISTKLMGGGRGGAVFARGNEAFGVFLGETVGKGPGETPESCWELVTGLKDDVLRQAERFRNKDSKFLSSHPSWRLPLYCWPHKPRLEASLEAIRRPHGYSIVVKVETWKGVGYSEGAVETTKDLERRQKNDPRWETGRIGLKWKKSVPDSRNLSASAATSRPPVSPSHGVQNTEPPVDTDDEESTPTIEYTSGGVPAIVVQPVEDAR